jgi:hypothetical protein
LIFVYRIFQLFEYIFAGSGYFFQLCLFLVRKMSLGEDIVDISKDIRKVLHPATQKSAYWNKVIQNHSLVGDCPELIRCIDEAGTDSIGKLDCREEVANTEAKAHRDFEGMIVIIA